MEQPPPPRLSRPWQLTMLKELPFSCHWQNFWHGLWLFAKLTFWKAATTRIAVYSLTDSAFKPWTTTEDNIQHVSVFSMSPGRGAEKTCYFVYMCVQYPCVMMCSACVASGLRWMWQHGIFVLQWGMPLTLLSLIKTQVQQQSEHKHTPWSLVCMGIHTWGHNKTVLDCVSASKQEICAKLPKQIATKILLVWVACCLAMELINIASVKYRSITNDG